MKKYIDTLKKIETLVELSIGTVMTEDKAADIYALTNELMCMISSNPSGNVEVNTGRYTEKLDPKSDDDIYTLDEWYNVVEHEWITNGDGRGYWVKDGLMAGHFTHQHRWNGT